MNSISNRQLTLLRKLQHKKHREKEQRFIVEGERAVEQVIENGVLEIEHLIFDGKQTLWNNTAWAGKIEQFRSLMMDSELFLEVADTENPQGVLALCSMPPEADVNQLIKKKGVLVATDRIQDPGNLGTIVRTASWFGVKGLLLGKGTVDMFNPKVVRSTAGTTGTLPFVNVELDDVLTLFEGAGWQTLLLDASESAENIREINIPAKTVLVIGNEANGISPALMKDAPRKMIKIISPSSDTNVESLNASIALSIALYVLTGG